MPDIIPDPANPPAPGAQPAAASPGPAELKDMLRQLIDAAKERETVAPPSGYYDRFMRFCASGVFFMIVGMLFLLIAYFTIGHTFAAMSFVFVVVGVGVLLYGTGTQGVGDLASAQDPKSFFTYKIALAGGAGITAFCVAGGIVKYHDEMKRAFQIEQGYLRIDIYGKGLRDEDMSHYLPEVSINGEAAPAVRRSHYVEVYLPYFLNEENTFEIQAKLHLIDDATSLLLTPEGSFKVTLKRDGEIVDGDQGGLHSKSLGGFDFPVYRLRNTILLADDRTPRDNLGGNAPH